MADPWLIAIFVAGLLALWPGRRRLRTVAAVMLGTAMAFLCLKDVLFVRADRIVASRGGITAGRRSALGIAHRVGRVRPHADRGARLAHQQPAAVRPSLRLSRPVLPESALVTASRSLDTVKNFLRSHEFGFAVEAAESDGRTAVRWSDLRYCWLGPDRADGARVRACGSAASLIADGRALTQEVTIGRTRRRVRLRGEAEQHVGERRPSIHRPFLGLNPRRAKHSRHSARVRA